MDELSANLKRVGQGHILEQLDLNESHPIYHQLSSLNIEASVSHFKSAQIDSTRNQDSIRPVSNSIDWGSTPMERKVHLETIGKCSIGAGHVGAVILSGGQGTRLGFAGPKGMYDMGLISGRTIFKIHVDRIRKIRQLAAQSVGSDDASVPIYIMTSDINDRLIRDYFAKENYFDYPKDDIFFFQQGVEPCFTFDGKIIIESTTSLSVAPDGNGGIYRALKESGAIDDMVRRGIQYLHIYGIDNVMTRSLDPAFIGLCIENNVDCGNKVVWRANKSEKVGVTAVSEGCMCILEYSEIPADLAEAVDSNGRLIYGAANICNHYLSLKFLIDKVLPEISGIYHLATKKIPYMDPRTKENVTPAQNNGYKLEMFIFDVFPLAEQRWIVMEVDRNEEFAPVKNEPGNPVDSPDTARRMMSEQAKRWLLAAGAKLTSTASASDSDLMCELSPQLSYAGEGLEKYAGKTIELPAYLE